jgi:hypothetical protein
MDASLTSVVISALIQRQSMLVASLAPPSTFMDLLAADDVPISAPTLPTTPDHRRAVRTPRVDISTWDDRLALLRMRFTIPELRELVSVLRLPPTYTVNRVTVSSLWLLGLLLRRLAWSSRLVDLAEEFGMDRSSISMLLNHLFTELASRFRDHLKLWSGLTPARVLLYATAVTAHSPGVRQIWGFVDGTTRPIARPNVDEKASYSGHDRYHAQTYQGIVTPDGLIVSICGPALGSRDDLTVWRESGLEALLMPLVQQGGLTYHLFGDKAYLTSPIIMHPFKPALTQLEKQYNIHLSGIRINVEHCFGRLTNLWSFTDMKRIQRTGLQPTAAYYFCMVLFTNLRTCMDGGNQITDAFGCNPPTPAEYIDGV